MHESSMLRMRWFKETHLGALDNNQITTVVDVGSQCVLGQATYKALFAEPHFNYVGVDMEAGDNVDVVLKRAYQWDELPDHFCEVLISGQTFEHIEFPWLTMGEMARVLKPGGILCIIVPSMQNVHRFPVNCQNYFSDGLIALAKYAGLTALHASTDRAPAGAAMAWHSAAQDSMLVAVKPPDWRPDRFDKLNYVCEPADLEKMATGLVPIGRVAGRLWRAWQLAVYATRWLSAKLRRMISR